MTEEAAIAAPTHIDPSPTPTPHIVGLIADAVDRFGDRPLIEGRDGEAQLSYAQAWAWAGSAAASLRRAGAAPGQRLVVRSPKSIGSLIAYLAALRLGAVWVPVAPQATPAEMNYVLEDASPTLVIDGAQAIDDLVGARPGAGEHRPPKVDLDDLEDSRPAAMLYTSGTTGRPKGVPITGTALGANTAALVDAWGFSEHDTLVHSLPTNHAHGLFVALGCALASGATMRWVDRFDAAAVAGLLPGATAFMGVPTHYVRLLDQPGFDRAACASLRLLTSGSAPLPAVTFERIAERTGIEVVERYGMTETLMLTSNPLGGPRKPGSVGVPLPGVEVRLAPDLNADTDVGMVEVRGPSVFDNYWGRPPNPSDRTAPAHPGDPAWFRTGDLGRWDADGYLYLVGRSKDLIICGGLNVYPAEVEAALERHPAVAEVAVIGLPDDEWGQVVAAVVVASSATDPLGQDPPDTDAIGAELVEAARSQLSAYKLPRRLHWADSLPRNAMGKVDKVALRDSYGAT